MSDISNSRDIIELGLTFTSICFKFMAEMIDWLIADFHILVLIKVSQDQIGWLCSLWQEENKQTKEASTW